MNASMTPEQYRTVQLIMENCTGIHLAEHKRVMVESRLASRLKATNSVSFDEYLSVLTSSEHGQELQCFIDRLTTHETRFFREDSQFDQLANILVEYASSSPFKVWSAACSTGEEVYSLAMVLEQHLGTSKWSVLGSDISESAIKQAKQCHYAIDFAEQIPRDYRKQFCLRGVGKFAGKFTISEQLRRFCKFECNNLLEPPASRKFNAVFLRNVLFYFDVCAQKRIVDNVIEQLEEGGYLFLGHSENVIKSHPLMQMVDNCVYRKEAK